MQNLPRIAILGAGCIGAYIAGSLLPSYREQNKDLVIIGREKQQTSIKEQGLKVTDYLGNKNHTLTNIEYVTNSQLTLAETPATAPVDILLLTVKCTAVKQAISDVKHLINPNTIIVTLQNGFGSEIPLIEALPDNKVLTGIVGFNVVEQSAGHYHRGTEGEVIIEQHHSKSLQQLILMLNQHHIPSELSSHIKEIRWGKLLLNLNNAINALSNMPLKAQLETRDYRKLLANCMIETITLLKKANIKPAQLTKVSPTIVPYILKLPNWLFKRIANQMLAIDPLARSSMWYDITQNRKTEIDFINGAVVNLSKRLQLEAPFNLAVVEAVKKAEEEKRASPELTAKQISPLI